MEAVLVNHYDAKVKCEELYGNTIHQSVTQQNAKKYNSKDLISIEQLF